MIKFILLSLILSFVLVCVIAIVVIEIRIYIEYGGFILKSNIDTFRSLKITNESLVIIKNRITENISLSSDTYHIYIFKYGLSRYRIVDKRYHGRTLKYSRYDKQVLKYSSLHFFIEGLHKTLLRNECVDSYIRDYKINEIL